MPSCCIDDCFDYAIVGMGIGDLALWALLAHVGKKVVIFEQHYVFNEALRG
jgi:phytoene dehydrogenase-like protein